MHKIQKMIAGWRYGSVVEYFFSTHKALSSIPNTEKKDCTFPIDFKSYITHLMIKIKILK